MVTIKKELLDKIIEHAQSSYPYEGCGILTGIADKLLDVIFVENKSNDRKKDRYEIDPKDFLKVDMLAKEKKQDILGFYHSHPDHPAMPSNFDIEHAWPEYIYIIVSVMNGAKKDVRAWKLYREQRNIKELNLTVN